MLTGMTAEKWMVPAVHALHIFTYPYRWLTMKIFFLRDWNLNSQHHTCKAGALPLEPHLQSSLLWLFWRQSLMIYLRGLTSNLDPPDLSLPSS
jgi:hypothetical protein